MIKILGWIVFAGLLWFGYMTFMHTPEFKDDRTEMKTKWNEMTQSYDEMVNTPDIKEGTELVKDYSKDNLNPDSVGDKLGKGIRWTKDKIIDPVIDYTIDLTKSVKNSYDNDTIQKE